MTETQTAAAPAASKPKMQTVTRTLTDGKNELQAIAASKKDGSFSVYSAYRKFGPDGKVAESQRGASSVAKTLDEAKAGVDRIVKQAIKDGWQEKKSGGGGGFKPRPDSFNLNSLPKPAK